ncbi:MAG: DUF4089 domain-containing protein [Burkholderiales bacterium]|nr:DUF4089 domain-containing protein [Burkholderiales bacterium]
MEEAEVLQYVKSAAQAVGLPLDEARAAAVAQHFARTFGIAKLLEQAPLAPEHELAEIYQSAPFPAEDPS